jgi:hypothetical protein
MRRAVGAAQRDVSSMDDRPADASRIHLNSSQCVRRAEVYFALALQWPLWLALRETTLRGRNPFKGEVLG